MGFGKTKVMDDFKEFKWGSVSGSQMEMSRRWRARRGAARVKCSLKKFGWEGWRGWVVSGEVADSKKKFMCVWKKLEHISKLKEKTVRRGRPWNWHWKAARVGWRTQHKAVSPSETRRKCNGSSLRGACGRKRSWRRKSRYKICVFDELSGQQCDLLKLSWWWPSGGLEEMLEFRIISERNRERASWRQHGRGAVLKACVAAILVEQKSPRLSRRNLSSVCSSVANAPGELGDASSLWAQISHPST